MHADDTSLHMHGSGGMFYCSWSRSKDLSWLNGALNEDPLLLDAWLISNKMSLNVAKTQSMLVSAKAKGKESP